jgi:hypothetical protein
VIRSICYFNREADPAVLGKLEALEGQALTGGYSVQTLRVCAPGVDVETLEHRYSNPKTGTPLLLSLGALSLEEAKAQAPAFLKSPRVFFHLPVQDRCTPALVDWLLSLFRDNALKSFHFAFTFENVGSSPFFPSSHYVQEGFSVGLQSTNWAEGCAGPEAWLAKQKEHWYRVMDLFGASPDFLGLDSSVAPLGQGSASLLYWIEQWYGSWDRAILTDFFMNLTRYIKEENPQPIGLCGLMLPCLEDFHLADAYEQGEFSLERNLFLSLHSGLGIDTYPLGLDEDPERILGVLELTRRLAQRYSKPLSIRFISDGKSKIGQRSQFDNIYLKEVVLRGI